jgi:molecular chaperone GrpE
MADNQSKPTEGEPDLIQEPQAVAAGDEIARLKAELEDVKDRALRGWAELENYRKRSARQLDDERRYAALPLMRDLLPVLDNVQRAVDASEKNHDAASLLAGIKMVVQQLEGVLGRHHCTPIPALHKPFDPNVHDAILHQPSPDFPPNTVLQEVQQGFRLHDRVVRPTQVIVSSPSGKPGGAPSEDNAGKP